MGKDIRFLGMCEDAQRAESQLAVANDEIARMERFQKREKQARVYYQDIVYYVCNKLDAALGNKPLVPQTLFSGAGVVCGTSEAPETGVQEAMGRLCDELERLQAIIADLPESWRLVFSKEGAE